MKRKLTLAIFIFTAVALVFLFAKPKASKAGVFCSDPQYDCNCRAVTSCRTDPSCVYPQPPDCICGTTTQCDCCYPNPTAPPSTPSPTAPPAPPPSAPPAPPPSAPPAPGYGACGGCDCGHGSECQTDPSGACIWNPGTCGGGGGGICNACGCPGWPPCWGYASCAPKTQNIAVGQTAPIWGYFSANGYPDYFIWTTWSGLSVSPGYPIYYPGVVPGQYGYEMVGGAFRVVGYVTPTAPVVDAVVTIRVHWDNGDYLDYCRVTSLPQAWWQVTDGDIYAGSSIYSSIPPATVCVAPTCTPVLIKDGVGGTPGTPMYAGLNASTGPAGGQISSKNWLANAAYGGKNYNYAYFASMIPSAVLADPKFIMTGNTVFAGSFASNGVTYGGYRWIKHVGDLTIEKDNLNKKVILFVENGNLTIRDTIKFNQKGKEFFMAIVGNTPGNTTGGNIIIDPLVTDATGGYALEGLYLADGQFSTGIATTPLKIRGSIVSSLAPSLQRDLGVLNGTMPAESVEFAPDLVANFPPQLSRKKVIWKEVAP